MKKKIVVALCAAIPVTALAMFLRRKHRRYSAC